MTEAEYVPGESGPRVFLRRCRLRDYRSIAAGDVVLQPLTLLVGPNGAGKSNFIDALRLVSDALTRSVEHALQARGGIQEVRRRSVGHPGHCSIRLDLCLPGGQPASYRIEIGAAAGGSFRITREQCQVGAHRYEVQEGQLVHPPAPVSPPLLPDRLYLVNAAGLPEFRPLYDALVGMGFYQINPERIRDPQLPDEGVMLARDAGNLASVVRRMSSESPAALRRVEEFLAAVVPGLEGVQAVPVGRRITMDFLQRVEGAAQPWRFPALDVSDGTLRALALLVGLFQPGPRGGVPLLGIEEPETALHPAAAAVLLDALRSATHHCQVLVTTHSPELLDHPSLLPEEILAVQSLEGRTIMGPPDEASRSVMRDGLYTGGELLRASTLSPETSGSRSPLIFEHWGTHEAGTDR